ncbi:hypothetical protein V494_00784, partial [Pseudogymnoascus sp. VKM F-4513 (FW-928)]
MTPKSKYLACFGLDSEHHPRFELAAVRVRPLRRGGDREARGTGRVGYEEAAGALDVVGFEADVVAELGVSVLSHIANSNRVTYSVWEEQASSPRIADLLGFNAARLHLRDNLIDSRRLLAKRPTNGKSPRNIRSIALPLTARIQTHEFPPREVLIIRLIMQRTRVLPGPDDRRVRLVLGVLRDAGLQEDGLELGLVCGGVQAGEDLAVGGGGDLVGAADEGDFVGGFDDARFVYGGLEGRGVE